MLQTTFKKQQERWYQDGFEEGIERGIERGIEKGIEQGIEKGIEEGIEQGREEGIEEGVRRTARAMLARGIDPVLIAEVTGLTGDELNALLTSPPPDDMTS